MSKPRHGLGHSFVKGQGSGGCLASHADPCPGFPSGAGSPAWPPTPSAPIPQVVASLSLHPALSLTSDNSPDSADFPGEAEEALLKIPAAGEGVAAETANSWRPPVGGLQGWPWGQPWHRKVPRREHVDEQGPHEHSGGRGPCHCAPETP